MDEENTENQTANNEDANLAALESIKKRALESFMPLVDSLDQAPERKFNLLMTAVQTSHSSELLEKALASAQEMSDPSSKADALLDVINEANYQSSL